MYGNYHIHQSVFTFSFIFVRDALRARAERFAQNDFWARALPEQKVLARACSRNIKFSTFITIRAYY